MTVIQSVFVIVRHWYIKGWFGWSGFEQLGGHGERQGDGAKQTRGLGEACEGVDDGAQIRPNNQRKQQCGPTAQTILSADSLVAAQCAATDCVERWATEGPKGRIKCPSLMQTIGVLPKPLFLRDLTWQ